MDNKEFHTEKIPNFKEPDTLESSIAFRRQNLQHTILELYYQFLLEEAEATDLLRELAATHSEDLTKIVNDPRLRESLHIREADQDFHNIMEMNNIRQQVTEKIKAIDSQNWTELFTEIIKTIQNFNHARDYSSYIRDWLSLFLEEVYFCHRAQKLSAAVFADNFKTLVSSGKICFPNFLSVPQPTALDKRQPSFLECTEATLERYQVLEKIEQAFIPPIEGIIVGGSMSYGPFYNIRKNLDNTGSSDIDVIMIMSSENFSIDENSLAASGLFYPEDITLFLERIPNFKKLYERGEAEIMSQKFRIINTDFDVSLHFFTKRSFAKMLGPTVEDNITEHPDEIFTIKDYKAKPFTHPICLQRGFDNSPHRYEVPTQTPTEDGGVITLLPNYATAGGKFYPGIYQNLVSPRFKVFADTTGETTAVTKNFKEIMSRQLERERQKFADEPKSLLQSHIRFAIFPPELSRRTSS